MATLASMRPSCKSLENKVNEARKQGNEVLCSLMLDEMAIMKKIEFDGKKTFGFVDIGSGVTDDGAPAATQALVFMVVCVNGSWKVPIGFFFIHGMTGKEKANLVRECLHQLGQMGIKEVALGEPRVAHPKPAHCRLLFSAASIASPVEVLAQVWEHFMELVCSLRIPISLPDRVDVTVYFVF
ncbi:THAP domain-containing protein 9 [Plakobranchus ocellatus]|uniref:THAP domain-containing protein 9 n=1 Tax=Plakobranchus ocellatus TaxID=259542 RepID=A0AAV4BNY2_9GAST|nr:THAP domain-containing protein 9 [Plakobranchus ocellatus]